MNQAQQSKQRRLEAQQKLEHIPRPSVEEILKDLAQRRRKDALRRFLFGPDNAIRRDMSRQFRIQAFQQFIFALRQILQGNFRSGLHLFNCSRILFLNSIRVHTWSHKKEEHKQWCLAQVTH